ncbi:orotate phosphoribosyltransferase [Geomicrobium sp. JCM 19038]|uniref:orotate phosphoribosyltransferase n=1 Tax=Geomicrobium sp. JCM 19038 TaxID=1460635 RepID=UPI00045F354D|nr:orotate phosphoribosyltransferase [Geomicrobium sp. JCM 19038]GAK07453.1 orotate phosphoribosyltransferase [Geomicrobium sp. JCM 19038]
MNRKQQLASELLDIEAVSLKPNDPFTWSSGLQAPIYCDNRLTLSHPSLRSEIAEGFKDVIAENYADCDVIAGTATAGIPHAAIVSDRLELPMIYVRGSAKKHGKGNLIEGKLSKGDRVVVVEDLISTGKSSIDVANAIQEAGGVVVGVVAIFSYGLKIGMKNFAEHNISHNTLTDFQTLIEQAIKKGVIQGEEQVQLKQWQKTPENWR